MQTPSIRALLDKGHPRAPDLDRVGSWLGTDRPLLFRGALKGRVVLLDFWTSGCVNCLHALPVLRAVEERFRGQPFQVVGIHSGKFDAEKEVSAVAEAMARHGVDHPVATDSDPRPLGRSTPSTAGPPRCWWMRAGTPWRGSAASPS